MPAFDPERSAHRLAKWGWVLAVAGLVWGGIVGLFVAAVGIVLLLLACVSRRDGFLLLGPVAVAEVKRTARTGRPWVRRVVYALAAAAVVALNVGGFGGLDPVAHTEAADTNRRIGLWFAVCLFLFVAALAVQVYATAIPDDRRAQRWDVLRATALRPREMLFGKLAGRLPLLFEPLLTATPVLAVLPLFGGVSAWFPAAVLMCCAAVAVGLGGVALFYSVFAKSGWQAVGWTALMAFVYLLVSGPMYALAGWLGTTGVVGRVAAGLAGGNPIYLFDQLTDWSLNEDQQLAAVGRFVLFHLATGLTFALVAVRRLPRAEAWDMTVPVTPPKWWRWRKPVEPTPKPEIIRPPMTNWPIVWLELGGMPADQWNIFHYFSRKRCAAIIGGWTAPCLFVALFRAVGPDAEIWQLLANTFAVLALFVAVLFVVPILPLALLQAAQSVARERAANTLDSLRLTPLSARGILFQKWLGVTGSNVPLAAPALAATLPPVLTGIVPFAVGVFLLVGLVVVIAAVVAVGLAISVRASTPLRASILAALLGAVAAFALGGAALSFGYEGRVYAACVALPPVAAVAYPSEMQMPRGQPVANRDNDPQAVTAGFAAGVLLWGAVGGLAWWSAVRKLERERIA